MNGLTGAGGRGVAERKEAVEAAVLSVLAEADGPMGATRLAAELAQRGWDLRPRTVRFHLGRMDGAGWTRKVSRRRGRELTAEGREEAGHAHLAGKLGFVAARVDNLGYRQTFDLETGRGQLVVNAAALGENDLARAAVFMEPAVRAGLGMGTRMLVARAGEAIGSWRVPEGCVGLGTVCSVALNGIMLKAGIPVTSRFGGLLEMRGGAPVRFVQLIEYRGSTLDPLEAFIEAGMTSVRAFARTGSGVIGASFREVPNLAAGEVARIQRRMRRHGLRAILAVGRPGAPLLGLPVSEGHTGLLVIGGLNPVAAIREAGVQVQVRSLAGLHEYGAFSPFDELARRVRRQSYLID